MYVCQAFTSLDSDVTRDVRHTQKNETKTAERKDLKKKKEEEKRKSPFRCVERLAILK